MPIPDLVRDSTFGNLVHYFSNGRLFQYADERDDYVIPERYLPSTSIDFPRTLSSAPTLVASPPPASPADVSTLVSAPGICAETGEKCSDLEKQVVSPHRRWRRRKSTAGSSSSKTTTLIALSTNWSMRKKCFVGGLISLLTFAVYVGSAVYTSSIPGIMQQFNVSQVTATSGLTLFVAAYGIGPMLLSPMQELASWGRNPAYIIGLALFVIFQIPEILAKNIETVLIFRFLSGFVGSPALATGGASMADIFPPQHLAVAIGTWAIGAVLGPIVGPVIGGFAAQGMNWRWPFLELLWISAFAFVVLFFLFPETYEDTILLRRAQRLRKLTGNPLLKAPSEVGQAADATIGSLLWENVTRAVRLSIEPAIFVANAYIGLAYALFYLWFEAFPLVFTEMHHFNLGLSGLPFLGFVVAAAITNHHIAGRYAKSPTGDLAPEVRLEIGLFAAPLIPISLFIFGWTSRPDVHWIWPIIEASLYLPGLFLAFQSILMYISISYPRYAASLLAGNDFARSVVASVFPLFGASMFKRLGLGGGSSLLAGLAILMIPGLWAIMHYGHRLRARSQFTGFTH
ncbi:hypothetical protein JCM8097_002007 [Rhodosporidiobolus ruineniae]